MSFCNYQLPATGGGGGPGTPGVDSSVGVAIGHAPGNIDSTTIIPVGAVVTRVDVCVDVAYDALCTLAVYVQGGALLDR
jgi:hypothetical protein